MKAYSAIILSLFLSHTSVMAQEKEVVEKADVVEQILSLREEKAFLKAFKQAEKIGITTQVLLEAQFLYHIDNGNYASIVKLKDQALELAKVFSSHNSEIFSSKEDFLAVVNFIQALEAVEQNDEVNFKKHITEAYWLSPAQAPAFNPHIERFKVNKLKSKFTMLAEFAFENQQKNEKAISFKSLVSTEQSQGILIYAYSPWSRESIMALDSLKKVQKICKDNNLTHLHHNVDDREDSAEANAEYKKEALSKFKGHWTQDQKSSTLIEPLRIKSSPTLIQINKEGEIVFHGSVAKFQAHHEKLKKADKPAEKTEEKPAEEKEKSE